MAFKGNLSADNSISGELSGDGTLQGSLGGEDTISGGLSADGSMSGEVQAEGSLSGTVSGGTLSGTLSKGGSGVDDVIVGGESVVSEGIATIPTASNSEPGVVKVNAQNGLTYDNNTISMDAASTTKSGAMSASDKTKLNGISPNAEVNQNAFANVRINTTIIQADTKTDTLRLYAGNNITLLPNAYDDSITISANGIEYAQGSGIRFTKKSGSPTSISASLGGELDATDNSATLTLTDPTDTSLTVANIQFPAASNSGAGLMTASDKAKLSCIESGAQVNRTYTAVTGKPTGNLAPGFGDTFTVSQVSQDTTGQVAVTDRTVEIPDTVATASSDGLMSSADKTKLSGIDDHAEVNVIEAIKVNGTSQTVTSKAVDIAVPTKISDLTNDSDFVEDASYVHTDNNYTSTEKSKLAGIAPGATANTGTVTSVGVTAGSGMSVSGSPVTTSGNITVGHSNSVTPQSTQAVYPITIDAQGHVDSYGSAVVIPSVSIPGIIQMYGGSSAPAGWLMCDGSAVSRTDYAALFAVIGTTYGSGDGSTTFNLPDMQGRTAIGAGSGSGLTARSLGDQTGEETVLLTDQNMAHGHDYTRPTVSSSGKVTSGITGGSHHHVVGWASVNRGTGSTGTRQVSSVSGTNTNNTNDTTHTHDLPNHSHTLTGGGVANLYGSVSERNAHNNMQPSLAVNYIICTGL